MSAVQLSDGTVLFESKGSKNDSFLESALSASLRAGGFARQLQLRCRVCAACRTTFASMWATRLQHEHSQHDASCFLTLTYSPEFLPEGGTLDHRHVQLFLKRLRFEIKTRIRFFCAGEYGGKTQRPHYHLIIFGYDFPDKHPTSIGKGGHLRYSSPSLARLWGMGHCDLGTVTPESMGYVAYYNLKRLRDDSSMHANPKNLEYVDLHTGLITTRRKEYCRMSNRPGIGANWFANYRDEIQKGFVTIAGSHCTVPDFYIRKLKAQFPDEYEMFITSRTDRMAQYPQLTVERLDALHEFNLVRANQTTREAI
jgi:hypothetical protein